MEHGEKLDDRTNIARSTMNIGNAYSSLGNNELAVNYYQKSYEQFDELSKEINAISNGIPIALLNIGIAYQNQGKYEEALKKYQKALEIDEQIKIQSPSFAGSGNAIIFHGMGEIYQYQGNFERSLEYFNRSLEIKKDYRDKREYIGVLVAIAENYVIQGNFEKARKYLEQASAIAEQNRYFEPDWYRNFVFGKFYVGSKQPLKARQAFDESIKNAETLRAQGNAVTLKA